MLTDTAEFDAPTVYDEASLDYEAAAGEAWGFLTHRTHALLDLAPGDQVLDAPTGTGLLLPLAAASVGPAGRVLGVDLAPAMLALARERAGHLPTVELAVRDVRQPGDERFDAVACVLGLFFVDDMGGLVRSLADRLAPGGRLVIAVFGEDFFEPLPVAFADAVRSVDPRVEVVQPWRRTATREALRGVLDDAGIGDAEIVEKHRRLLAGPSTWRRITEGSGLRRALTALGPDGASRAMDRLEGTLRAAAVDHLRVSARYVVIRR